MQIIIFVAGHFGVREITIFVHLCTVDCPKFCVLKISIELILSYYYMDITQHYYMNNFF